MQRVRMTLDREKEIKIACDVARGPFLVYCRELLEELERIKKEVEAQDKVIKLLLSEAG